MIFEILIDCFSLKTSNQFNSMVINKKTFSLILLTCSFLIISGCFFRENKTFQKLSQILESGNAALRDKQYDKAIEFYDAGLKIAPKELAFLNNKSLAMRQLAADLYNTSIRLTDEKAKTDGVNAAKKKFVDASVVSSEAVKILKNKSSLELFILGSQESLQSQTLESHAESMRLLATIVDNTKANDALEAMREYIDTEPDQAKKLKTQLSAGKMLLDTYNGHKAFIEYKKVLDSNPNNLDAILGIGMALAQSGQADDFREAKRFLQRFVNEAPADHPSMTTAKEILKSMS